MCAACTSPSMRASEDTTSVPGWSGSAATLPRTSPSTRNPPLKITLPSMRVVAPIRLSIRFCGLLVLLNTFFSFPLNSQRHRLRRARLGRSALVDAHLHAFHFRLRVDPESPFDPSEILESQPECRCRGVARLREGHHSIVPPFLQADDELEAAAEVAPAPVSGGQQEQPVAVFPRQYVRNDLELVDGEGLSVTFFRCEHVLHHRELFAHAHVLLLERAHLLGELLLRGALDRDAAVGRVGDRAQARELGARRVELGLHAGQLLNHLAAVEAGEAPPRVVDPVGRGARDAEQDGDARPAPVPRNLRLHLDARRGDAEALADDFPATRRHYGTTATWSSPVVSGNPNMRFMFCTACPEAPFTRLSITDSTTTVSERLPLSGGRCTASRQVLAARTERVSGWLPSGMTSTNGSLA